MPDTISVLSGSLRSCLRPVFEAADSLLPDLLSCISSCLSQSGSTMMTPATFCDPKTAFLTSVFVLSVFASVQAQPASQSSPQESAAESFLPESAGPDPTVVNSPAAGARAVDFLRDVRPILRAKCVMCHNDVGGEGGLRLDQGTEIRKGGESGPVVIPGHSADSRLLQAVLQQGDLKMPPPDEGQPLSAAQIEILRNWIDQGAVIPDDENRVTHWAFQKPLRPVAPQPELSERLLSEGWGINPIDAFIADSHQQHQLHAAAPAPKAVLLRRLYLDLIGLPPTPEQMNAFLADESANAWNRVVDQLLDSPHYGERWGRHWMDVWRYSDWDGYGAEVRESKPHIWRWRDWIIESLNSDKPYDRMLMEMLAADELSPGDPDSLRATGYLVRNWYVFNRNTWIDSTIEHTGKAFMGMTFNCARCHDHMYDPVRQTEYYQLRAFFEPHDVRTDRVPGQSDLARDGLVRVFDATAAAPTHLFARGDEKNPIKDKPLSPLIPVLFGNPELPVQPVELPPQVWYPGLQDFVVAETRSAAQSALDSAVAADTAAQKAVANARAQREQFQQSVQESTVRGPVLQDDFSSARSDVWRAGPGDWKYQNGRLVQTDPADTMLSFQCLQSHPADFTAALKFRVTGGDVYKSVGLAFDGVDEKNLTFVYASVGGGKLQAGYKVNGADEYPAAGAKPLTISQDQDQELVLTVQGTRLEIRLNGQEQLVWTLPNARPSDGHIYLWTYDAAAEFRSFELRDAGVQDEASLLAAESRAESAAQVAVLKRSIAEKSLAYTEARIAADKANYAQPTASEAKDLSLAAGRLERELSVMQEELKLLTAQQALHSATAALAAATESKQTDPKFGKAVADAEASVAAAKTAVDVALKLVGEPHEAYARLTPVYPQTSTGRRLALARWIAGPENPLTARVAVNHMWMRHFHQPLVTTVFDFGMNGKTPSHPELLDWLACELVEQGWRMKALHRLIVTSATYRMASTSAYAEDSALESAGKRTDAENRFLWKQNVRRMEAEVVRDAALHIAGQLDTQMYGPDLDPATGMTVPRRSIYFRTSKEKKMTFLATFDSANPVECYQRAESISPQQSLAMSNSPLTLAQSRLVATRLTGQGVSADEQFVDLAFQYVLSREATAAERTECVSFLATQAARLESGSQLTVFPGTSESPVKPAADARQRARENLVHVLFNHNDFVTIR